MARLLMMTDFSKSYTNRLLRGIMHYSKGQTPWVVAKVPLALRDTGRLEEVVRFAESWKADAIIGQFRASDPVEAFTEKGIITIALNYERPFTSIPNIKGNYAMEGRICADYFISKDVHNFAFFGIRGLAWSDSRRDAFLGEIRRRVPEHTESVFEEEAQEAWWYDSGKLVSWLSGLPKPVAILACDDDRAYYIVEAAMVSGKEGLWIPEDIMVLGVHDNKDICELCEPSISSLHIDVEDAGYRTGELIDRLLADPGAPVEDIVIKPLRIHSRRSTQAVVYRNKYVEKVINYVMKNPGRGLLVDELIGLVPQSRRAFEVTFKAETGMTIHQFIIRMRVERMKELLESGIMPTEAADSLGIDYNTIARNFKALTGETPSKYSGKK